MIKVNSIKFEYDGKIYNHDGVLTIDSIKYVINKSAPEASKRKYIYKNSMRTIKDLCNNITTKYGEMQFHIEGCNEEKLKFPYDWNIMRDSFGFSSTFSKNLFIKHLEKTMINVVDDIEKNTDSQYAATYPKVTEKYLEQLINIIQAINNSTHDEFYVTKYDKCQHCIRKYEVEIPGNITIMEPNNLKTQKGNYHDIKELALQYVKTSDIKSAKILYDVACLTHDCPKELKKKFTEVNFGRFVYDLLVVP